MASNVEHVIPVSLSVMFAAENGGLHILGGAACEFDYWCRLARLAAGRQGTYANHYRMHMGASLAAMALHIICTSFYVPASCGVKFDRPVGRPFDRSAPPI